MRKDIRFKVAESTSVRCLLEQHLTVLFLSGGVNKYIANGTGAGGVQTIPIEPNNKAAFHQIKLAYDVWLNMLTADRHAVLAKFYTLYANLCNAEASKGKALTFCALFINEFADILATAMQWPD